MARITIPPETKEKAIETDEENGVVPFFIIDDTYGIGATAYSYALIEKSIAYRTNPDTGECEKYTKYQSIKWGYTIEHIFECYVSVVEKAKLRKIIKSKDFNDIIKVRKDIKESIDKAILSNPINHDTLNEIALLEKYKKLEELESKIDSKIDDISKKANELLELIKQKRSIIIKETEGTKHRMKLED